MEVNVENVSRILNITTLDDLFRFFFSGNFKQLTKSKDVFVVEFGNENHKVFYNVNEYYTIKSKSIKIFEYEKLFLKKNYLYNAEPMLTDYINECNFKPTLIPMVVNNKLTKIIIMDSIAKEEEIRFISKIIEVVVEKIAEKELLLKINNDFQEIFSNINSLIILRDKNYNILYSNKQQRDVYKCFDLAFKSDLPCDFCPVKNKEITENIGNKSYKIQLNCFSNKYLCIIEDISNIIKLKEELTRAEKLSFLGRISSEITHEVKNPLNSIKLKITLLEKIMESNDGKVKNILNNITSEIDRLSNIVNDFLQFGKNIVLNKSNFFVEDLIYEILNDLNEEINKFNIKTEANLKGNNKYRIYADRNKIKQTFLNLINNSIEALKSIGNERKIIITRKIKENNIIIEFKDNGNGIKDEKNLFTPFYTTKKSGTGLGLIVSKKNVETHNGKISYARKNNFTVFTVELPVNL